MQIQKKSYTRCLFGFTLAEVLITLGIIGVVAAMTLPTLIANYKEKEMISAWKKGYSDISNAALLMSQYEEDLSSEQLLAEAFAKYIKIDKICELYKAIEQGCWSVNTPIYSYNGKILVTGNIGYYGAGAVCMNTISGGTLCIDASSKNAILLFDVNGTKKPNKIGRDVFAAIFNIDSYGVRVVQGSRDGWGPSDGVFVQSSEGDGTCEGDIYGYGCSAVMLLK